VNGETCRNYARFLTREDGTVSVRYVRRSKHINEGYGIDYGSAKLTVYTLGWSGRTDAPDSDSIIFTTDLHGTQSVVSNGDESLFDHGDPVALSTLLSDEAILQSWLEQIGDPTGCAATLLKLLFPAN